MAIASSHCVPLHQFRPWFRLFLAELHLATTLLPAAVHIDGVYTIGGRCMMSLSVYSLAACADCEQSNIKTKHAFTGLRVTIDCKLENGHLKTRGVGKLDEEGKFKMSIHRKIVKDGKLNEECYAQLHSASAAPCPAHNGLESSKVVL
ncbi:proline-rich protein 4-like [Quercus robur]|uniref:proline-rich protein 4-like n=1 Tax=Quercus robur TaxID=38942 RepID=UPI002161D091|nr:proline-rich protein 4-like [Quercus robur]